MLPSERTPSEPLYLMQRAVARCLQLYGTHSPTRITAFRDALYTIKSSGSSILRVLNDASPINRLSDELLTRLLSYVSLGDQRFASQVCHRWRHILQNISQLRDDINLCYSDDKAGFTRATTVLTRFPKTFVSLNLLLSTDGSTLFDFLTHYMARIRRMSIDITPTAELFNDTPSCRSLALALGEPAPTLEQLDLLAPGVNRVAPEETYLSEALFAGFAPRLRSLTLSGIALHDRTYPALTGLRTLVLNQAKVDIAHIVAFYPALEALRIDATSLVAGTGENWSSCHLEILHLSGTTQAAEIVCNWMDLARPLTVWAEAEEDELLGFVLAHTPPQRAYRLELLFYVYLMQPACVVEYSSGVKWVMEVWPDCLSLALCNAELMASIAELMIHELVWPRQPLDLPSALNVTILEVVLYHYPLTDDDEEDLSLLVGVFSDDDESLCMLHCPALETLSFLSTTQPALVVDVFDVLGIVERLVRFSAELLPCLRLRNVSLYDPESGRGMELLTARLQRVEYCDFTGRDVPLIHQKHNAMSWIYGMMQ